jgi:hypothetical protein
MVSWDFNDLHPVKMNGGVKPVRDNGVVTDGLSVPRHRAGCALNVILGECGPLEWSCAPAARSSSRRSALKSVHWTDLPR